MLVPAPAAATLRCVQVCQLLSVGNWTLERDEDLTGPYAFLGNKWIAFDDDTSLKIKAKYALLRDLAGVGLMSVDADDVEDVCGKGRQSLLRTLASVWTSLQRKPRQLIVTSLEEDLLATAQNVVPVTQANGECILPTLFTYKVCLNDSYVCVLCCKKYLDALNVKFRTASVSIPHRAHRGPRGADPEHPAERGDGAGVQQAGLLPPPRGLLQVLPLRQVQPVRERLHHLRVRLPGGTRVRRQVS